MDSLGKKKVSRKGKNFGEFVEKNIITICVLHFWGIASCGLNFLKEIVRKMRAENVAQNARQFGEKKKDIARE